jgi:hypothetical protein
MVKAAPLTIGSGHFGASRVTERNTSVNNNRDAKTTNPSTVHANVRPVSGCDSQSKSAEAGCISSIAPSSSITGSGGSRRTGSAITFTGLAETMSPSSSSSAAVEARPLPAAWTRTSLSGLGAKIDPECSACSEIPSRRLPKIHWLICCYNTGGMSRKRMPHWPENVAHTTSARVSTCSRG